MTLAEVDSMAGVSRRRDRMLGQSERDVEDATAAATRQLLGRILDRADDTLTASLVAAPTSFVTSSLFTLGEVQGWWADAVDEHVRGSVFAVWRSGHFDTSDAELAASSLARAGDYLANVTDRLSRTATPTVAEDAFDLVRVALADEIGRGSSISEMSRRLGAELNWQGEDVGFWQDRLSQVDSRLDSILDGYGPPRVPDPGDPARLVENQARTAARLNDPQVSRLQAQRSELTTRIARDRSTWQVRAERIARTETTGSFNAGALDAGVQEGARVKVWIASIDDRTRETHLDTSGQCVGIDGSFDVGGTELQMPGDPAGPPEEIVNCRCTVVFDQSCEAAGGLTRDVDEAMERERERRGEDGPPPVE